MSTKIERCIFCDRTDLDREHVWSTWTHEFIRKSNRSKSYIRRQFSTSAVTKIRNEVAFKERPGDITTLKLKVVCKNHCNAGWMSRLENRVKPILIPLFTGSSATLNKYNQEILSTWIAMKLMVSEFSVPDDVVIPASERSLLMGRRQPPDIMAIWISHYKGDGWSNAYVRHSATIGWAATGTVPIIPPGSLAKNVQSQTFTIGELFVQAVATTVRELKFRTPAPFAPWMRQIWPYQSDFEWPLITPIHDFHAHLIVTAFDRFAASLPVAPGASHT